MKVTLVIFNENNPIEWNLGEKFSLKYTTNDLLNFREKIIESPCNYILFWDAINPLPELETIKRVIASKGNLWHIGSYLGLQDEPELIDYIQPTSMLHVSISPEINHSSWKNTFNGCLMEKRVFEFVPLSNYSNSLDIIGLDFGYKAIKSGVFTRYSKELSRTIEKNKDLYITKNEQLLFIQQNFDKKALIWTYINNVFKINPISFYKIVKQLKVEFNKIFKQQINKESINSKDKSVSAVIATLERYPFLSKELIELRELKTPLKEIIIVDQTPKEKRNQDFLKEFTDLPIKYLESDIIGQCTARNLGVKKATSKFIWFLDDDMEEIPKDYLNKHLETIYSFNADVSCGVPDEIGTNYIERKKIKVELSDGFPTNDVLVKRSLINEVGGFDEKMDQKQSEDQEIGLRCVKNGALSLKNNQLRIVHLRAPRGGLRNHNVRKVTFSSSRNSLTQRRLLHHSEIYLNLKHFSKDQVKKHINLNIRGTFIYRGSYFKKIIKIIVSLCYLPLTVTSINKKVKEAKKML